jgi:hypothetical protein
MDMQKILVDLSSCSETDRQKYRDILKKVSYDVYPYADNFQLLQVMWELDQPITDFVPGALVVHSPKNT